VWSLPANQAVAYGADMDYCIVESESGQELVLIAQDLLLSLSEKLRLKAQPLATFKGFNQICQKLLENNSLNFRNNFAGSKVQAHVRKN
jgi:isoleucyl-tRNA synthetase